jgi:WD40 repeat protein
VWDIKSGEQVKTLRGHRAPVLDVRFHQRDIFSCSKDFMIKKWDLQSGECSATFVGHVAAVNAISLDKNFLASASGTI